MSVLEKLEAIASENTAGEMTDIAEEVRETLSRGDVIFQPERKKDILNTQYTGSTTVCGRAVWDCIFLKEQ